MNSSDQISIAHSKIDKFESILLLNHILKLKIRNWKTRALFQIKTAKHVSEFKLDYETFPANIKLQSPSQIKCVEKTFNIFRKKIIAKKHMYFRMLRVYNSQYYMVDQIKLLQVFVFEWEFLILRQLLDNYVIRCPKLFDIWYPYLCITYIAMI